MLARKINSSASTFWRAASCRYKTSEPFQPIYKQFPKKMTAEEAVSVIKSGDSIFMHGCAAIPLALMEAMSKHGKSKNLRDCKVVHLHTEGSGEYTKEGYQDHFRSNSLFIGANCRDAVNSGRGDYTPIFLQETPLLFQHNIIPVDVALISVSPPDEHGFCSIGTSVDCTRAALKKSKYTIAQVNANLPRTFGDSAIHQSHIDVMVMEDRPLPTPHTRQISDVEIKIGQLIAENLIHDGATLQMGIGSIPDVVLSKLQGHKNLGVHTEMFSDGVLPLIKCGALTNSHKHIHTGKIVSSFSIGSTELYDFMDNNPLILMLDVQFVNDPFIISQNPRVTAINSCIEIDLTGQVVSDSIGERMYSGVGGQVDFLRGAALSDDGLGKAILALPSLTSKGESKIVPFIKQGGGVVTTRAHVHYVVTEYGIAYLFGKTLRQRAYELIQIAHPDHRQSLEEEAYKRLKCMPSYQ